MFGTPELPVAAAVGVIMRTVGVELAKGSSIALGRNSTGSRAGEADEDEDAEDRSRTLRVPSWPCELAVDEMGDVKVRPWEVNAIK